MIPELENVLAVLKTIVESIKKFLADLVAIVKGTPVDEEESEG